jgi:Flp pilus assembly protein TadD
MVSGKVLLESGQPAEALVDFQIAKELEPASLLVKLWLGLAQARSGNRQLAVKLLGDVAPLVPEGWRAYGELGSIAHKNGNLEEALGFFEECTLPGRRDIWTTGGAWVGTRAPILDVRGVSKRTSGPAIRLTSSKPTIVLFWMTGNGPSRNALAQLRKWEAPFGEQRVAIVAVNVDKRRFSATDRDKASRALGAASITLPCWLDRNLESFARFDISSVPTTVLIDHRGVVVRRVPGTAFAALHEDLETLTSDRTDRASESSREGEASQGSQGAAQQGQVFSTTADRHLGMARHQARLGRLTPALESARQALGMAPQSAAAKALVAHLLLALGRAEEAAKLLSGPFVGTAYWPEEQEKRPRSPTAARSNSVLWDLLTAGWAESWWPRGSSGKPFLSFAWRYSSIHMTRTP